MSGPVALEVADVSVSFGGLKALDDVSLTVRPGELVGLIGPNGSGKTTMLNVISGVIKPSNGRVVVAGTDVTRKSTDQRARRGLARTFQRAQLFPELTVRQHIELVGELHRRMTRRPRSPGDQIAPADAPRGFELIARAAADVSVDQFGDELSTAASRLVELAMALTSNPHVLLADEPLSGLTSEERHVILDLLTEVARQSGVAVLLVEHDIESVAQSMDRVAVLHFGSKIADGDPATIFDDDRVREAYFGG